MGRIILVESGSSKTTVYAAESSVIRNGAEQLPLSDFEEFQFAGYNPNRPQSGLFNEMKAMQLSKDDHVFFYGSGLGSEKRKIELKVKFQDLFDTEPEVYDDLVGAGRALYGEGSGLFAILGTGGVSAYYNGNTVINRTGGYGYLLDDVGGGYELGKLTISAWLNNDFSSELTAEIESVLKVQRDKFITTYYTDPTWSNSKRGLDTIAGLVKLLSKNKSQEGVKNLLELYFDFFFKKNILPIANRSGCSELKLVGSIAENFKEVITKTASKFKIEITKIVRYPALSLFAYHVFAEEKRIVSKMEGEKK